jgi:hypothetical protein
MKIKKLFAIAALLLGSTSAFALYEQDYTYEGLVYALDVSGSTYTATVKKVSDDATYKAQTTWTIPEKFKALAANGANATCADKEFTVIGVGANAFAGNTKITTVDFAKSENIKSIGASAFSGCTALTTLTLGKNIESLGAEFIKGTAITSIDLSGNVAATLFLGTYEVATTPGTASTAYDAVPAGAKEGFAAGDYYRKADGKYYEITTAGTGVVAYNVFESAKLQSVIFTSFKADGVDKSAKVGYHSAADYTNEIPADAFKNCLGLTSVILPKDLTTLAAGTFKYTKIETLDLSYLEALLTVDNLFGATSAAPFASLTTLKLPTNLKVKLVIGANAFAYCTGLTTLNIPAAWHPVTATYSTDFPFAAGSFTGAGVTEINFTPTLTSGAYPGDMSIFAVAAFSTSAAPRTITFNTIREYVNSFGGTTINKVNYEYTKFDTKEITLNGNYALLKQSKGFRVSVDKAIVYSLYVDPTLVGTTPEGTVYMVPFKPILGEYRVGAGKPVLVKAKVKNEKGNLEIIVDNSVSSEEFTTSELKRSSDSATELIVDLSTANSGKYINIAAIKDGVFGVGGATESYLAPKTYYVPSFKQYGAAGARIVWLDEDETTAIQTIQTKAANDGVVYNLQGVRVNAAYKGVVIKNGKKMIQK